MTDYLLPIAPLANVEATSLQPLAAPRGTAAESAGFAQWVEKGLSDVNNQLAVNQTDLQALATGDVQNLHQVMIRLEESRLSFQLMMQVRSRLLEAYQDIMKMPI